MLFFIGLLYLLIKPELAVGELQTDGFSSGDQWFSAISANEVSIDGPNWISDNGDPTCTWALEIPETYTGIGKYSNGPESGTYNVTRVKDRAYENLSGGGDTCALVAVTGGTNIEEIGDAAFSTPLKSGDISLSGALEAAIFSSGRLVVIGDHAFFNNPRLTRVELGNSLQAIGDYAFLNAQSLSSINLPDSVTAIGEDAFWASGLTSIEIPSGITKIESGAFGGIDELRQVTMSDGVTAIKRAAFATSPITKLTMSKNVQTIDLGAFYGHALEQVSIPATTTLIASVAFGGSTTLTDVIFYGDFSDDFHPESFDGSPNLKSIRACPLAAGWDGITFINGTADISVDNSAPCTSVFSVGGLDYQYTGTAEQEVIVLKCTDDPCYSTDINIPGTVAFNGRTYTVKKIDDGAFCVNDAENPGACDDNSLSQPLTSVVIGENVTIIGETAFFNNRLTSIDIPNSVTTVSQYAFFKNQLTDVVIPNGVRTIGAQAFDANPSLTKLT
ncbi:MAG: leucine-rich repeat domain-containing protein, partial [Luminiphilus sp.]|nr:leucine-rich repeat domain-containing protein [Luminiphilus sp.]